MGGGSRCRSWVSLLLASPAGSSSVRKLCPGVGFLLDEVGTQQDASPCGCPETPRKRIVHSLTSSVLILCLLPSLEKRTEAS